MIKKPDALKKAIEERDIIDSIEHCMHDNMYWVTADQIAQRLKISRQEVKNVALRSDVLLINNQNQLTTRKLYKEHTPFLGKLIDTFKNSIG